MVQVVARVMRHDPTRAATPTNSNASRTRNGCCAHHDFCAHGGSCATYDGGCGRLTQNEGDAGAPIGLPHPMQAGAASEISLPQSGHFTRTIRPQA
jgi:hypothetical protein